MHEHHVRVGRAQPYAIHIGPRLLQEASAFAQHLRGRHALVVSDSNVAPLYARRVVDVLRQAHPDAYVETYVMPPGEGAKTLGYFAEVIDALVKLGATRDACVFALGGGVVGDLAGFAAACWMRGIDCMQLPTTLLAMVDSSVGGKTAVDLPQGKNLVGAFHEPAGVLCDLSLLATLPREELVAGLGEVIKCGFIADPVIVELIESVEPDSLTHDSPVLAELIERAIRVKIDVVVADLKETGGVAGHPGREALNYGHTLAHAIEKHEGYRIRHGEAVALGCLYAAELARLAGRLPDDVAARHRTAFGRVGLPTSYGGASFEELIGTMRLDKKSRGSTLRFLVLDGLAQPSILAGPSEELLREAYEVLG